MTHELKLGSLFDGSGGFPLAGILHGIRPVWASEIEEFPIRVTKNRFPNMKHLGSVTDVNGAEAEPVDIITFGSPCQDLSVAGKQLGIHDGERSNLFFEAMLDRKNDQREREELLHGAYRCARQQPRTSNQQVPALSRVDREQEGNRQWKSGITSKQTMGGRKRTMTLTTPGPGKRKHAVLHTGWQCSSGYLSH